MGSMSRRPSGHQRRRVALASGLIAALGLAAAPVLAADSAVSIAGFAFGPGSVSIEVGDTVTWTNDDNAPHTATAAGDFDTGTIAVGESASVTFDTAGTYDYVCSIHPTMSGTVIVAGVVSSDPPSITPAPTDTVPAASPEEPALPVPVAAILATLGVGMLIGTFLAGRRGRATGD